MDRMLDAIVRGIKERKPVVVGSGHALSKDFTVSGCIPLWFLQCYGKNAKVAMTAPTDRQVKKVMWGELTQRYQNRRVKDEFGRLLSCHLDISPEWYALAFTTKETGGAVGKFQGFHASAVMVIVSEAQAVDDAIFEQIEGIMTSQIAVAIYLGNPLRTTGRFAAMLKDTTNNIVVNLSCLESPNVLARKEVIPGVCSYEWVEQKRKLWGEADPRWISRVLGQVPKTSVNTVISDELYQRCVGRDLLTTKRKGAIGVDPARYGDDDMVITVMESGRILEEKVLPYCSAPEACSQIAILQKNHFPDGQCVFAVDCDGLGGPYLDFLKQMIPDQLNCKYMEIHGASTDKEKISDEYQNARAQIAFYAKTEMEAGRIRMDEDIFAREEATAEQYFVNARGKIQLEDKDDIKERLGRSPDRWDARKLAIWGLKFAEQINKKDRWRFDDVPRREFSFMSA